MASKTKDSAGGGALSERDLARVAAGAAPLAAKKRRDAGSESSDDGMDLIALNIQRARDYGLP